MQQIIWDSKHLILEEIKTSTLEEKSCVLIGYLVFDNKVI